MKRVPSAAVVVFFALAVAGCRDRNVAGTAPVPPETTSGAAATTRPLRIAMIAKSASNPSFVAARTGAENRARELSRLARAADRDRMADAAARGRGACRRDASPRR